MKEDNYNDKYIDTMLRFGPIAFCFDSKYAKYTKSRDN